MAANKKKRNNNPHKSAGSSAPRKSTVHPTVHPPVRSGSSTRGSSGSSTRGSANHGLANNTNANNRTRHTNTNTNTNATRNTSNPYPRNTGSSHPGAPAPAPARPRTPRPAALPATARPAPHPAAPPAPRRPAGKAPGPTRAVPPAPPRAPAPKPPAAPLRPAASPPPVQPKPTPQPHPQPQAHPAPRPAAPIQIPGYNDRSASYQTIYKRSAHGTAPADPARQARYTQAGQPGAHNSRARIQQLYSLGPAQQPPKPKPQPKAKAPPVKPNGFAPLTPHPPPHGKPLAAWQAAAEPAHQPQPAAGSPAPRPKAKNTPAPDPTLGFKRAPSTPQPAPKPPSPPAPPSPALQATIDKHAVYYHRMTVADQQRFAKLSPKQQQAELKDAPYLSRLNSADLANYNANPHSAANQLILRELKKSQSYFNRQADKDEAARNRQAPSPALGVPPKPQSAAQQAQAQSQYKALDPTAYKRLTQASLLDDNPNQTQKQLDHATQKQLKTLKDRVLSGQAQASDIHQEMAHTQAWLQLSGKDKDRALDTFKNQAEIQGIRGEATLGYALQKLQGYKAAAVQGALSNQGLNDIVKGQRAWNNFTIADEKSAIGRQTQAYRAAGYSAPAAQAQATQDVRNAHAAMLDAAGQLNRGNLSTGLSALDRVAGQKAQDTFADKAKLLNRNLTRGAATQQAQEELRQWKLDVLTGQVQPEEFDAHSRGQRAWNNFTSADQSKAVAAQAQALRAGHYAGDAHAQAERDVNNAHDAMQQAGGQLNRNNLSAGLSALDRVDGHQAQAAYTQKERLLDPHLSPEAATQKANQDLRAAKLDVLSGQSSPAQFDQAAHAQAAGNAAYKSLDAKTVQAAVAHQQDYYTQGHGYGSEATSVPGWQSAGGASPSDPQGARQRAQQDIQNLHRLMLDAGGAFNKTNFIERTSQIDRLSEQAGQDLQHTGQSLLHLSGAALNQYVQDGLHQSRLDIATGRDVDALNRGVEQSVHFSELLSPKQQSQYGAAKVIAAKGLLRNNALDAHVMNEALQRGFEPTQPQSIGYAGTTPVAFSDGRHWIALGDQPLKNTALSTIDAHGKPTYQGYFDAQGQAHGTLGQAGQGTPPASQVDKIVFPHEINVAGKLGLKADPQRNWVSYAELQSALHRGGNYAARANAFTAKLAAPYADIEVYGKGSAAPIDVLRHSSDPFSPDSHKTPGQLLQEKYLQPSAAPGPQSAAGQFGQAVFDASGKLINGMLPNGVQDTVQRSTQYAQQVDEFYAKNPYVQGTANRLIQLNDQLHQSPQVKAFTQAHIKFFQDHYATPYDNLKNSFNAQDRGIAKGLDVLESSTVPGFIKDQVLHNEPHRWSFTNDVLGTAVQFAGFGVGGKVAGRVLGALDKAKLYSPLTQVKLEPGVQASKTIAVNVQKAPVKLFGHDIPWLNKNLVTFSHASEAGRPELGGQPGSQGVTYHGLLGYKLREQAHNVVQRVQPHVPTLKELQQRARELKTQAVGVGTQIKSAIDGVAGKLRPPAHTPTVTVPAPKPSVPRSPAGVSFVEDLPPHLQNELKGAPAIVVGAPAAPKFVRTGVPLGTGQGGTPVHAEAGIHGGPQGFDAKPQAVVDQKVSGQTGSVTHVPTLKELQQRALELKTRAVGVGTALQKAIDGVALKLGNKDGGRTPSMPIDSGTASGVMQSVAVPQSIAQLQADIHSAVGRVRTGLEARVVQPVQGAAGSLAQHAQQLGGAGSSLLEQVAQAGSQLKNKVATALNRKTGPGRAAAKDSSSRLADVKVSNDPKKLGAAGLGGDHIRLKAGAFDDQNIDPVIAAIGHESAHEAVTKVAGQEASKALDFSAVNVAKVWKELLKRPGRYFGNGQVPAQLVHSSKDFKAWVGEQLQKPQFRQDMLHAGTLVETNNLSRMGPGSSIGFPKHHLPDWRVVPSQRIAGAGEVEGAEERDVKEAAIKAPLATWNTFGGLVVREGNAGPIGKNGVDIWDPALSGALEIKNSGKSLTKNKKIPLSQLKALAKELFYSLGDKQAVRGQLQEFFEKAFESAPGTTVTIHAAAWYVPIKLGTLPAREFADKYLDGMLTAVQNELQGTVSEKAHMQELAKQFPPLGKDVSLIFAMESAPDVSHLNYPLPGGTPAAKLWLDPAKIIPSEILDLGKPTKQSQSPEFLKMHSTAVTSAYALKMIDAGLGEKVKIITLPLAESASGWNKALEYILALKQQGVNVKAVSIATGLNLKTPSKPADKAPILHFAQLVQDLHDADVSVNIAAMNDGSHLPQLLEKKDLLRHDFLFPQTLQTSARIVGSALVDNDGKIVLNRRSNYGPNVENGRGPVLALGPNGPLWMDSTSLTVTDPTSEDVIASIKLSDALGMAVPLRLIDKIHNDSVVNAPDKELPSKNFTSLMRRRVDAMALLLEQPATRPANLVVHDPRSGRSHLNENEFLRFYDRVASEVPAEAREELPNSLFGDQFNIADRQIQALTSMAKSVMTQFWSDIKPKDWVILGGKDLVAVSDLVEATKKTGHALWGYTPSDWIDRAEQGIVIGIINQHKDKKLAALMELEVDPSQPFQLSVKGKEVLDEGVVFGAYTHTLYKINEKMREFRNDLVHQAIADISLPYDRRVIDIYTGPLYDKVKKFLGDLRAQGKSPAIDWINEAKNADNIVVATLHNDGSIAALANIPMSDASPFKLNRTDIRSDSLGNAEQGMNELLTQLDQRLAGIGKGIIEGRSPHLPAQQGQLQQTVKPAAPEIKQDTIAGEHWEAASHDAAARPIGPQALSFPIFNFDSQGKLQPAGIWHAGHIYEGQESLLAAQKAAPTAAVPEKFPFDKMAQHPVGEDGKPTAALGWETEMERLGPQIVELIQKWIDTASLRALTFNGAIYSISEYVPQLLRSALFGRFDVEKRLYHLRDKRDTSSLLLQQWSDQQKEASLSAEKRAALEEKISRTRNSLPALDKEIKELERDAAGIHGRPLLIELTQDKINHFVAREADVKRFLDAWLSVSLPGLGTALLDPETMSAGIARLEPDGERLEMMPPLKASEMLGIYANTYAETLNQEAAVRAVAAAIAPEVAFENALKRKVLMVYQQSSQTRKRSDPEVAMGRPFEASQEMTLGQAFRQLGIYPGQDIPAVKTRGFNETQQLYGSNPQEWSSTEQAHLQDQLIFTDQKDVYTNTQALKKKFIDELNRSFSPRLKGLSDDFNSIVGRLTQVLDGRHSPASNPVIVTKGTYNEPENHHLDEVMEIAGLASEFIPHPPNEVSEKLANEVFNQVRFKREADNQPNEIQLSAQEFKNYIADKISEFPSYEKAAKTIRDELVNDDVKVYLIRGNPGHIEQEILVDNKKFWDAILPETKHSFADQAPSSATGSDEETDTLPKAVTGAGKTANVPVAQGGNGNGQVVADTTSTEDSSPVSRQVSGLDAAVRTPVSSEVPVVPVSPPIVQTTSAVSVQAPNELHVVNLPGEPAGWTSEGNVVLNVAAFGKRGQTPELSAAVLRGLGVTPEQISANLINHQVVRNAVQGVTNGATAIDLGNLSFANKDGSAQLLGPARIDNMLAMRENTGLNLPSDKEFENPQNTAILSSSASKNVASVNSGGKRIAKADVLLLDEIVTALRLMKKRGVKADPQSVHELLKNHPDILKRIIESRASVGAGLPGAFMRDGASDDVGGSTRGLPSRENQLRKPSTPNSSLARKKSGQVAYLNTTGINLGLGEAGGLGNMGRNKQQQQPKVATSPGHKFVE